jgi:hypothetical protein
MEAKSSASNDGSAPTMASAAQGRLPSDYLGRITDQLATRICHRILEFAIKRTTAGKLDNTHVHCIQNVREPEHYPFGHAMCNSDRSSDRWFCTPMLYCRFAGLVGGRAIDKHGDRAITGDPTFITADPIPLTWRITCKT